MTTFHDLIHEVNWEEVQPLIRDYDEFYGDYEAVFHRLREMQPEADPDEQFTLYIRFQPEYSIKGMTREINPSAHVVGVMPDDPQTHWAVEFRPWKHWLAAPIHRKSLANYTGAQIVAACLWEITWGGFDEIEVAARLAEIDQSLAEALDPSKQDQLIPLEEFERRMRGGAEDGN